jgi:peroxiredoxin
MRRFLSGLFALVLSAALVGCSSDDGPSPSDAPKSNVEVVGSDSLQNVETLDDPKPVPDVTVETMDGKTLALAEQSGRVLLVNFWATWCPPCREEIPDLVELQKTMGPRGLTVVGVAMDEEGTEVVRPFADRHRINYPIVIDSTQTLQSSLGPVYGLPTTVIVNPEGQVVKRVMGIFPVDALKPTLEKMLASDNPSASS